MSATQSATIYDELLELLSDTADAGRLLAFRLSPSKQIRLDELLQKNRDAAFTPDESAELEAFAQFEHVVRMLKARLHQRQVA